jgi:hypothetical protein
MQRTFLTLALLLTFYGYLSAQGLELPDFNQASINHQKTAMLTLGGWAVTNIALGATLQGGAEGSAKQFHRMNALWNTVNLGIAGIGYFAAMKTDPGNLDLATSLQKHHAFQKVLLFNAGLDIGYIAGGLYLTERAKRPDVNQEQLKGFGQSIMLQGAFLFVFDLVNYFIASGRDGQIPVLLGTTGDGIGLSFVF